LSAGGTPQAGETFPFQAEVSFPFIWILF
jgi:hypothetical protein